jgi:mono/diheme cytochrome c family protein
VIRGTALALILLAGPSPGLQDAPRPGKKVDFGRDVQPILAQACLLCHGPDAKVRKADLRLDTSEGATAALEEGRRAVVPGKPDQSELIKRIMASGKDAMPPAKTGKKLTPAQIETLRAWVAQGAPYAKHWAFVKPVKPAIPAVKDAAWPKNDVDRFILARLESAGMKPSPEADRLALARRLSIDLTGLPPAIADADRLAKDPAPDAVERYVDGLLASPAFGEAWARVWLDLARYADSQGYAEDRPRVIWPFRDWVIQALNQNMPFDQFTVEQLAGDLLPDPTDEKLRATGFHRNTLTNTEGGTDDEEFRNAAVVDRVSTTMQVWMGLTMNCAQCHDHKYDPLSQEEFFRLFSILNQTEDYDRADDSPFVPLYSEEQKRERKSLEDQLAPAELELSKADVEAPRRAWEAALGREPAWKPLRELSRDTAGETTLARTATELAKVAAIRLEVVPEAVGGQAPGKDFILARFGLSLLPGAAQPVKARVVRLELPGAGKMLHLAEVQVFAGGANVAPKGKATQSSTDYDGPAPLAIDGNTNGDYHASKSVTHTRAEDNPWWQVDLGAPTPVERVVIWNRTDGGEAIQSRLQGYRIRLLDEAGKVIEERKDAPVPSPSAEVRLDGARSVVFRAAFASAARNNFGPELLLKNPDPKKRGWSAPSGKPSEVVLVPERAIDVPPGSALSFALEHAPGAPLGSFKLSVSDDPQAAARAELPPDVRTILGKEVAKRSEAEKARLVAHFKSIAPELASLRERIAALKKKLAELKPAGTVPVMKELNEGRRRKTQIQVRGNFLDKGKEVTEGVPAVFPPLPADGPPNRLALARWLVHPENPLTARVIVNRYWERLFGAGLVSTSEDFGVRGEAPSHPELLDALATRLVADKWDIKALVRLIATSATYRQSSKTTAEMLKKDPNNRLLSVGPRQRLTAEQVRDQALAASGLLSGKIGGPSVYPPRPKLGLSAAFSSSTDWEDSKGEDRYRRGLYTFWRRSTPYPSMATFDAPSCEVTTMRRIPTNTPLQALVTMNDPVYVEAAQALARRMVEGGADARSRAEHGFRRCLSRAPRAAEVDRLVALFEQAKKKYAADAAAAKEMATNPLGPAPAGMDVADLAAWTVVGNVLLNLDEVFMKR